jgi:hypothetical protein
VLPEHLEFFINWEERDYRQREEQVTRESIAVPRTVPSSDDYAGGFIPYFFHPSKWMVLRANTTAFPKKYLGAPTAIILKAALAVLQPFPEDQQLGIGIQDSVISKLCILLSLYKRGQPSGPSVEPSIPSTLATVIEEGELAPGSGTVATTVQGIMPTGTTDWPPGKGYCNTNKPEQCYHNSPSTKGPMVERPQDALPRLDSSLSRSTPNDTGDGVWDPCYQPSPEPFAFGPESTSATVMSWVAGIRGLEVKRSE